MPIFHSVLTRSRIIPSCTSVPLPPLFSTVPYSSSSSLQPQDSQTLKRLHHKDWLLPDEVLKITNALRDPKSVTTLLDLYSRRKDYKPNEAFYTLVIHKLSQANMFDAIEDLMQRIQSQNNCKLSDDFFYNVIKIYGNAAGRVNKAMDTLFDMPKKHHCWPSVKTFNFVLNLLVSQKLFSVVHELYKSAPKLGVEIDACCLNILIKGLCECGKLEDAFHVLDEFPNQRCKPNVRTFSTLMHALCARGKVDEAFGLFERMEKDDIFPDTITFNILILGLRKQRRVEEGMKLFERMKLKGCYPNSGTYQQVLYGLLETKKFIEAKEFMGRMILEGYSPSYESYKLMLRGLCKANLVGDVDWVLKQMVQQGFVPTMGMWKWILRCMLSQMSRNNCISYEEIVLLP